jgi:hypothetical protein
MPILFESSNKDAASTSIKNMVRQSNAKRRTIMTPLTCFAISPDGVRFETQEQEETVILFLRQHLIVMLPSVFLVITLAFAPIILLPLLIRFVPLPVVVPTNYVVVGTAFWYVLTFGVALTSFLRWFFNIYIVTNIRIVDIDFLHLLYKEFSEARIEKIQDMSYKSGGILAAFFNFGNVLVETAGETPNIEFEAVPAPAKVVETISQMLDKEKKNP